MALWNVDLSLTVVVEADDAQEAFNYLHAEMGDILRSETNGIEVGWPKPVKSKRDLRGQWAENCLPYGGDDDRCIGYILDHQPPDPPPTPAELESAGQQRLIE